MSEAQIESWGYQTGDMELFKGHLTTLLDFGFVFAIFTTRLRFNLVGNARATRLELYFCTEYPFGVNLILTRKDETRNADFIVILLGVTFTTTIKTV